MDDYIGEWLVELGGDDRDLQTLTMLTAGTDPAVVRHRSGYFLRWSRFAHLGDNVEAISDLARRHVAIMSGAAHLELGSPTPITVGGLERPNPDGSFSQPMTAHVDARGRVSAELAIIRADGTVEKSETPNPFLRLVASSEHNSHLNKVLRLWRGPGTMTWVDLYRIYEVIREDLNDDGPIVKNGWATAASLKRFRHTANSSKAAGDAARHGAIDKDEPPANPMPLSEANELIGGIIYHWVGSK